MILDKPKRIVAFCDCSNPDHHLIMDIPATEENPPFKELMIYYNLRHYQNFWPRLKNAYKYVMQIDVERVDYLDIMIYDHEELKKLKDMIDEVYEYNKPV